ncbi:PIG-L family deacetylase [Candidatus Gottesmanbacteria bacterium]|nr:PIG-L family deacetylase [Candidatus Gottesmanbacteria bacterium]
MNKILGVFAHPSDALIAVGGTLAKYVHAGRHAELVCAINDNGREKVFEHSASLVGTKAITFFDYDERTFARLHAGEVEDKVYKEIAKFVPNIVLTFEMNGMTNNPDHMRIARSTTFAFQKYAAEFERRFPDAPQPKLYYACIPQSTVLYFQKARIFPKEAYGALLKGVEDKEVTTTIDLSRFSRSKIRALETYEPHEFERENFFFRKAMQLFHHEYFVCRFDGMREVFMGRNDRVSNRL